MANDRARGGEGIMQPSKYYDSDEVYLGNYQYISIADVINNFTAVYVGENKILANVLDGDIHFHAHRALQELSYDTLKSCKTQEIVLPPSLQMALPNDYVNYTKLAWSDENGIEHIIYPTSKTGNHNTIQQDAEGNYLYAAGFNKESVKSTSVLLQDHDGLTKGSSQGYKLESQNYGLTVTSTYAILDADYSGPFRLEANFVYYHTNSLGGIVSSSQNTTQAFLKEGMQIFHNGMQPNTTIKDVTRVETGTTGNFTTQFYLSKPTKEFQGQEKGFLKLPAQLVNFDDITSSSTWGKYKSSGNSSTSINSNHSPNPNAAHDHSFDSTGQRRGLDPQYAQANGSFFINHTNGKVHFSSDLSGKTIILHYLSDHHGEKGSEIIHKFAEEAMYKWIAYGCSQARTDVDPGTIARLKQEKQVETRKAKIRLSNIKIEEISQIMRGKSKFLDH